MPADSDRRRDDDDGAAGAIDAVIGDMRFDPELEQNADAQPTLSGTFAGRR